MQLHTAMQDDNATRCRSQAGGAQASVNCSKAQTMSWAAFYRQKFLRLGLPVVFWSLLFLCYGWLKAGHVDLRDAGQRLLSGMPAIHLWFLFMLLGLYAAAPFLAAFLSVAGRALARTAVILGFAFFSGYALIAGHTGVPGGVFTMWLPFVPYFLLGPLVLSGKPLFSRRAAVVIFVGSVLLIALLAGLLQPRLHDRAFNLMYDNLNPLVTLSSLAVLSLFHSRLAKVFSSVAVQRLASVTLGIYVLHPLVIDLLGVVVFFTCGTLPVFAIPVMAVAVFVLSAALCLRISRSPFGRRLVC
jgi:surface polysaccharide O-acyltransferase-like enzyme